MIQQRNSGASILRNIDWITVLLYLLMVAAGVVSIYAASYDFDQANMFSADEFSGKQVRWIGLSFLLGLVILLIDSRMYETYAFPIYVVVMLLLLITPYVAHDIKGSRSWISFGSMSLQPAEFAKFATALALAKLFSGYHFILNAKFSNYVKALVIILLPVALILNQNETGSALTFMALFFVLYREGMSGLVLFAALISVVIFVVVVKFTDVGILGIPSGEFAIMVMIALIIIAMSFIYDKHFTVTRNLVLGFASLAILLAVLSFCNIDIPGMPVMLGAIIAACLYVAFEAIHLRRRKLFIATATGLLSVMFMFSVNVAFNYLQPHQQQRVLVAVGIVEDLRGAGYNVNQSKIRYPDQAQICARTAHRLHILHHRRGRRFCRRFGSDHDVSDTDTAHNNSRRTPAHHLRPSVRLLCGVIPDIPLLYQYRHGHRPVPCHRHTAAVLQLRRFIAVGLHNTAVHTAAHRRQPQDGAALTAWMLPPQFFGENH